MNNYKNMDLKEINNKLNNLIVDFYFDENFEVTEAEKEETISTEKFSEITKNYPDLKTTESLYSVFNGCTINWNNSKENTFGSVKIQSIKDAIEDEWQDMVTDVKGSSQNIDNFRVFDFFVNQEYVGFFTDTYSKTGLYYVRELDAYPLNLTVETYFTLVVETMGLLHWQSLIVLWEHNIELTESKGIVEKLTATLPNFENEKFKELYISLKMK